MNNFYHSFHVAFNCWYVILPACMLLLFLFGTTRYFLNEHSDIIRRGRKYRALMAASVYLTDIIVIALFLKESLIGTLQVALNSLPSTDAPEWAIIITIVVVIVFAFVVHVLSIISLKAGMKLKLFLLKRGIRFPG